MDDFYFKAVTKQKIADRVSPVGLYLNFRDRYPQTLLLESSDYHSKEDSSSFLCIDPLLTLSVKNRTAYWERGDELIDTKDLAITSLTHLFEQYARQIKVAYADEKPFPYNGFYGYMTYETVTHFERIKFQEKPNPAAIPTLQYSFYRFVVAINHFNDEMTILENIPEGEVSRLSEMEQMINKPCFQNLSFECVGQEQSNCTDEDFIEYVKKGKAHCRRGDVFQIVLSRQFQQRFKGDVFNVYRALRSINPSPYLYYFDYGSFQLMGSSPEAQIRIQNGKAVINPIAGTFRRTGDKAQDMLLGKRLLKDPKENSEHVMLVDLARNDLSKHTDGVTVTVFKEVQYFSHVIHLVSAVEGRVKKKPIEIVGDTFPAGTLSGAPKYRAMQLIDRYENQARGLYGGAIGFIGLDGDVNLAIAIRSFVSKNNTLYSQAGAGIVVDSEEAKELQEVNNKLMALKKAVVFAEKI